MGSLAVLLEGRQGDESCFCFLSGFPLSLNAPTLKCCLKRPADPGGHQFTSETRKRKGDALQQAGSALSLPISVLEVGGHLFLVH